MEPARLPRASLIRTGAKDALTSVAPLVDWATTESNAMAPPRLVAASRLPVDASQLVQTKYCHET
jgi:hypothetical protein